MNDNYWIYLSSLILCFAIGCRVWQYESHLKDNSSMAKVFHKYTEAQRSSYYFKKESLKENCKRRRSYTKFRDSLVLVDYFVDNADIESLKSLAKGTQDDHAKKDEFVNANRSYYLYETANLLLSHYIKQMNDGVKSSPLVIDSKILELDNFQTHLSEVEFDIYSRLDDEVELIYTTGGMYIPTIHGGAATKVLPDSIEVTVKSKFNDNTRKYEFKNIKV